VLRAELADTLAASGFVSDEPVVRSERILADFGAVALQKFEQVVATFGAYLRTGELSASGPLPAREEHRLMITGTAVGSFGFELEERRDSGQAELEVVDSSAWEALERVARVMEGALDSEEALAEEVSDLDARSLRSLHDFMSAVANREAWFRLEAVGHQVEFPDALQVHRTAERLQEDNLFEEEVELKGVLEGYLPHARTFELHEEALGLVKGKIAPAVEHPDELAKYLNQRVVMRVRKTVLGGGKPRFALLALPEPTEQNTES